MFETGSEGRAGRYNTDQMKLDQNVRHRRSIRLKGYDYSQPGAYFVTIVAHEHANIFGEIRNNELVLNHPGNIIQETWMHLPDFFPIRLDEWVLMPNHLHGIIWILEHRRGEASTSIDASPLDTPIGTKPSSVGAVIQNFKSVSTRKINQMIQGSRAGEINLANLTPPGLWQRNYYEHIIRNHIELERIRLYILENPRKWLEDQDYRR